MRKVDDETVKWAKEQATKLAGQPRPKTRPLREFLDELLEKARNHTMTDEEIAAQRASWGRQDMD